MNKIILFIFLMLYSSIHNAFATNLINTENQIVTPRVKKILLVVAMDTEAFPIINALKMKKLSHSFSGLPMQGYLGKYDNLDVLLILNGEDSLHKVQNVGTQAATLTTYLGIEYFHPDLVISIGTAGGVAENGAKMGDIYVSKKIKFYSRRIPIPGYDEYGIGDYTSANFEKITNKINLKKGIVCSGDSFDENQADREIMLKQGCSVIEMEAAGAAWTSMLMKTPMLAIKGITDIVGNPNAHEDFEKNFSKITNELSEKIKDFLSQFSRKNLHYTRRT